jgi:hypothetical protein
MTEFPCNASVLVYGPSKAGKTHLVASAPRPVLLLDAEGGSRFLPFRKTVWKNPLSEPPDMTDFDVCICYVRDFSTLDNVYTWLHSGKHPFRSVAIDSISEAQQRCVDAIAGQKQMTTPDWGNLLRKISALVRNFKDLLIHPLNPLDCVAFTAMERITPEGVHVPYLQGQIANVLAYYLDIVLYLKAAPNEETGAIERKLLTKPHPQYAAGDRTNRLPNLVVDASMEDILMMACDMDAPIIGDPDAFPDLAATAVDETGEVSQPPAGATPDSEANDNKETVKT